MRLFHLISQNIQNNKGSQNLTTPSFDYKCTVVQATQRHKNVLVIEVLDSILNLSNDTNESSINLAEELRAFYIHWCPKNLKIFSQKSKHVIFSYGL